MSDLRFSGRVGEAAVQFEATSDIDGEVERVFARLTRDTATGDATGMVAAAQASEAARIARGEGFDAALMLVSRSIAGRLSTLAAADASAAIALIGMTVDTSPDACATCEIAPRSVESGKAQISIIGVINAALAKAGAPLVVADLQQRGTAKQVVFRVKGAE